jgi:hypothetical protein
MSVHLTAGDCSLHGKASTGHAKRQAYARSIEESRQIIAEYDVNRNGSLSKVPINNPPVPDHVQHWPFVNRMRSSPVGTAALTVGLAQEETMEMVRGLGYDVSQGYLEGAWAVYDRSGDGELQADECARFLTVLRCASPPTHHSSPARGHCQLITLRPDDRVSVSLSRAWGPLSPAHAGGCHCRCRTAQTIRGAPQ